MHIADASLQTEEGEKLGSVLGPYVTKKVTLEPWSIASDENLHPNLV